MNDNHSKRSERVCAALPAEEQGNTPPIAVPMARCVCIEEKKSESERERVREKEKERENGR